MQGHKLLKRVYRLVAYKTPQPKSVARRAILSMQVTCQKVTSLKFFLVGEREEEGVGFEFC